MESICCLAKQLTTSWQLGWLSGDPHGSTAGLYQKLVVCVPVPCAGPGDPKQLQALCFGVSAGVFCLFTPQLLHYTVMLEKKFFLNQLCWF